MYPSIAHYKEPDTSNLSPKDLETYTKRKQAVDMYYHKIPLKEIEMKTGINKKKVGELAKKCTKTVNGEMLGYIALIPYYRVETKKRKKSIDYIMEQHPNILYKIKEVYYRSNNGYYNNISTVKSFGIFCELLREAGFTDEDYPFTLKDYGRSNFYRYMNKLTKSETSLAAARQSEETRQYIESTEVTGEMKKLPPQRPYSLVEIDGHYMDTLYVSDEVGLGYKQEVLGRPWIFAAIDVRTRCIVGYRLTFDTAYNRYDTIKCIQDIITPRPVMPGVREDGFPSQVIPETEWAMPTVIACDNAMAHLANDTTAQDKILGTSFLFGPARTPVRRPHIERFFGTLNNILVQNLPSTTGSSTRDLKRRDPEKGAVQHNITMDKLRYLVELAIAEYNNRFHEEIGGTPMQIMRQDISRGLLPVTLAKEKREDFRLYIIVKRKIVGSEAQNKRPRINYSNMVYSSPTLNNLYNLVGTELTLYVDPDDVNTIEAYLPTGRSLGSLTLQGKHAGLHLSLRNVERSNKIVYSGKSKRDASLNAVDKVLIDSMSEKASRKTKRIANNLRKDIGEDYVPAFEPVVKQLSKEEEYENLKQDSRRRRSDLASKRNYRVTGNPDEVFMNLSESLGIKLSDTDDK